ncbi:MAG: hypothetical protein OXG26_19630 [Caldilineaceae bacterium]|nr:hypothetical protein [Caldilineaceae bacterium]
MDERNAILDEIVVSGLQEALPRRTYLVLSAMAFLADPDTREVTKRVEEIAGKTRSMMLPDTIIFPDQVAGVIHQLCDSGIVEKVSEGDPPTYRVAADYRRLVEVKEMIDKGEQEFPHVEPNRPKFRQRGSRPL